MDSHKKGVGSLLFDEARDCPICLMEFVDEDVVIMLDCSAKHCYHELCLKEYMNSPNFKNECALCR